MADRPASGGLSNVSILKLGVYPGQGHAGSLEGGWLQSLARARARGAGLIREAELACLNKHVPSHGRTDLEIKLEPDDLCYDALSTARAFWPARGAAALR